jgi:alpha-1,2-mannosyltransferase
MLQVDKAIARRATRRRISWFELYGEPALFVLACISITLIFAVVLRPPATAKSDFYTFWDSGRAYHLGLDLYFGIPLREGAGYNLNAPVVNVLLFAPLAYLPLRAALALWTVANIVMLLIGSVWIARAAGVARQWMVLASLLLISQVTFLALQLGQPIGVLLLLMTAAWMADRANRPATTGVLLGVLLYTKPFLGLFVPYLVARRSWRVLAWMAAGGTTLAIIGLGVAGMAAHLSWLRALGSITWEVHLANASIYGVLNRLLTEQAEMVNITPLAIAGAWVRPLWLAAIGATLALSIRAVWRGASLDRVWALLILLALLISPLGWGYYVPLAAGPLAAAWLAAPRSSRIAAGAGYLFLCVPPTALLISGWGPTASATIGCAYFWGVLALWISMLLADAPTPFPRTDDARAAAS